MGITPSERSRLWDTNPKNKESVFKRKLKYRLKYEADKKNKQKVSAGNVLRMAIYDGRVKRLPCEICGNPKTHGHHEDYSKKLLVKWLCPKHHKEAHKNKL
jgi:hypothetical protein